MNNDVFHADFAAQNRPQIAKVVKREVTPWRGIERNGFGPDGKAMDGNLTQAGVPAVEACMVEIEELDAYGTVLYSTPAIAHRFFDEKKKKQDADLAVQPVAADLFLDQISDNQVVRFGLKSRFKSTIEDYERYCMREGKDLPVQFLADRMYPDLLNTLRALGVKTVQAFAALDGERKEAVKEQLRSDKRDVILVRFDDFQKRAQQKLDELGGRPDAPKGRARAAA
jgi:hypothetical protein